MSTKSKKKSSKTILINLPPASAQVEFATALETYQNIYLQKALRDTIKKLKTKNVDTQLHNLVQANDLAELASRGIRGEFLFPVPSILQANPHLLGYYRLLLGYSQKEFYTTKTGASAFKRMEIKGEISQNVKSSIAPLCQALIIRASELINSYGYSKITIQTFDNWTLLTLGAQLRGGKNNAIGRLATKAVFEIIEKMVKQAKISSSEKQIKIRNAAGRTVAIKFSSDPDIAIEEIVSRNHTTQIIAIEVKGGADISNIHNRIGEAEKSHQKAKQKGFTQFWTMYNVDKLDLNKAKAESPATNHFFHIGTLADNKSTEYIDFKNRLIQLLGI